MDQKLIIIEGQKKIVISRGGSGSPGLSAYELAVENGFVGTLSQWLQSLQTGSQHYTHFQSVASATWTVSHNLAFKPNVRIKDSGGTEVLADIEDIDINNLRILFANPMSGEAYCS